MHKVTEQVFKLAWALESAGVKGYWSDPEPEFAILLSFEEARELYYDIRKSYPFTVYAYTDVRTMPNVEQKMIYYPDLQHPPYPDGKRVVWATIEGIKIAIKGTEDD